MASAPSSKPVSPIQRGLAAGLNILSTLILVWTAFWTWLLRDGMGPDAVESTGVEAIRRFSSDFAPVAVFCLSLFLVAHAVKRY